MLDKEPMSYPSRNRFPFNPAVPDRHLWAIGMVIAQWSMTEWFIDMSNPRLIGDDQVLLQEYKRIGFPFQLRLEFWRAQTQVKTEEPARSYMLALVPRMQALNSQRDEIVHRLWGGGMEGTSWSADGLETAEAGLMPKPGERITGKGPMMPFTWRLTFTRLRQMAIEMAALNQDLSGIILLPNAPHGYVDRGGQVTPSA